MEQPKIDPHLENRVAGMMGKRQYSDLLDVNVRVESSAYEKLAEDFQKYYSGIEIVSSREGIIMCQSPVLYIDAMSKVEEVTLVQGRIDPELEKMIISLSMQGKNQNKIEVKVYIFEDPNKVVDYLTTEYPARILSRQEGKIVCECPVQFIQKISRDAEHGVEYVGTLKEPSTKKLTL